MIVKNFRMLSKEIRKLKDVIVISDNDLDGISSAKQMKIILDELKIKNRIIIRSRNKSFFEFFKEFRKLNEDEIILLDTPMPDKYLLELTKTKKVVYIDHHKTELPKGIPEKLIYFDYRAITGKDIATSILVYKLGKRMLPNFEKYSIFAMIGAIGDFSYDKELHKDFVKNYKELYNISYFVLPYFDLIRILENLDYKKFLEISLDDVVNVIYNERKKLNKNIANYYRKLLDFRIRINDKKLLVLECKKPSLTTTFLSIIYPQKVIVGYSIIRKFFSFENKTIPMSSKTFRDYIDLGKIAKKFAEKYGIEGGGHKKAAGVLINKKRFGKIFKVFEK